MRANCQSADDCCSTEAGCEMGDFTHKVGAARSCRQDAPDHGPDRSCCGCNRSRLTGGIPPSSGMLLVSRSSLLSSQRREDGKEYIYASPITSPYWRPFSEMDQRLGARLKLHQKTIEFLRQNVKRKPGVAGTAGMVRYAIRAGLLHP